MVGTTKLQGFERVVNHDLLHWLCRGILTGFQKLVIGQMGKDRFLRRMPPICTVSPEATPSSTWRLGHFVTTST